MTLTEFRYIVALARERHFGRAAETCFVSQPTLSVAVRKLEVELGLELFERGGGTIRPTAQAEPIIEQAQKVLAEAEQVKRLALYGKDPLAGPLRLGAIYTVGPYLFPDLIPELRDRAPKMPLVVQEHYTAELTRMLRQGELDVILISYPYQENGFETLPVYDEPFVVLVPAAHPLTQIEEINNRDLESENVLLLGRGHCFREQVLEACPNCVGPTEEDNGLAQGFEGSSLETIRHMVASGLGITILPCTAAGASRYSQRVLKIRRFGKPYPERRVALAWRKGFTRLAAIDVLKEAIHASTLSCIQRVK